MKLVTDWLKFLGLGAGAACAAAILAGARNGDNAPFYRITNLVSDGTISAAHTDTNLVNAWGIAPNPTGVWWVNDAGSGVSTLYDGNGVPQSLIVTVPPPEGGTGPSSPTGIVFNGSPDFVVSDGANSGPPRFIFATE